MLYGHLPPLRAVVVVLAVLIGAYGLEPGALTTVLLLIMYATARYAAVTGLAWFRFTRRRMRGITPVKLLDDTRMLAFQRVTLRIFDLPHHPRRLRQAVRRWREWRTNREHVLEMNARRRGNTAVHDRGDGLANLHDPDSYHLHDKTAGDETPRAGGHGRNTNSSDPGFEPRTSRTSDHIDSLSHAIERSPAYAALEACALTRALHPDVLRQLANNCMREVHVAAGEDVYRGRVLEDELAVLVAGTVAVGDDRAHAVGFGGDQRMGVESMMSGASHDGIDSAAEPTVLSRPGTCVTSLLDVLEGSQRVARGASAAPSVAPSVAPSIAGDLNDDTRSEAGSVATLPPTDLGTWEKDSHTHVNAKDAADPGEPAPGEPRTVTLKRLAEAAAAAHASVAVGGGGGSGAHFSAHGADSPAGSDSGIGSGVTATTADGEHNRAVVATSPGDSSAGAHAPPPTHVDRPPSHIPPASVASASVASGHSPRSSHPTTPTRGGPRGSGLSASRVGAAVAARILYPGVNPAEAVIGSGVPGHLPHHRTALEFSGGPGGLPRPRVRGGDGGCVLAVIPLADFHKAAGFQLGVQAAAMRLNGGYTALCHYLCMPNELGRLWVDGPDRVHGMSNDKSMIGGATFALARLLGPTAASQVDKSGLDYLLERRGYKPRRKSAGHYERPPSDGDDDIGVDSDTDRDSLASSTRMDTGPTGSHAGGNHKSDTSRTRVGHKAGPGSRGAGSGSNVTGATGRAGNTTVELEACELAPGELAKVRGSSNYLACLLVERGSLEGYWSPPDGRHGSGTAPGVTPRAKGKRSGKRHVRVGRERPGEDGNGFNTPRCFVAGPGCSVGGFLLLTGQKAAMTVRAGPGGAVIAALPHSAVARLARAHPHVYAHVATELARRLRPALPARLWDRCGAEWCALRAGEALVNSARGMSHAGRHPEGVYVVATGCVRLAGDPAGSTHGDGGHSNGHSADHPHPHASSVNSAMGHGVTDDGEGEAGVTRARFLGPGEAVGEDTVLRGVDGEAYGESGGFGRGNSGLKGPSRNGRDRGTLICGGANSFWTMMLGRFVTGAGVGASTQIVPVYLSEVSPPGLRGTVNGIRRMGYVVGCLMAFQLCGPLKDANMPDGYVKPAKMNGGGVDTYIDAVQSKGKFAVVAEKVKETAAAAGKDVVVRVESKVEKLEEKLKVVTEKDPSSISNSTSSSMSSSTSTDRAAGALAATSADAKAAPAVKLATTERPSMTVSSTVTSTEVKPATGKAGTEMGEKPEKAEKKAEPGKLPEASTTAAAPTKPPPESPSPPASTEPPKPMADAVKKSSTETSPAKESPPISTSTSATEAKKPTTSPGASKAEAQKTADAAAIAAYETATTSQLAPKPTADVASTKAAAAAVAKTVSKDSNSQGGVVSEESVAAVEAVVQMPTATSFVELKAIVKDAATVDAAVSSTVTSTVTSPEAKPGVGAEIEKKDKALLTEKPAVKSEDKPAIVSEKETVVVASPVAKDVASNAVPVVAKDASKDVVSKDVVAKDVVSKEVSKEVVSKESKPSVDDAAAVKKDSPDASSTKKDPAAGVTTGSALKKEKVDLEEKAAARIEEKSSKKSSGDASTSPKPTTTVPSGSSAATATSKDKGAKGTASTTTTNTSTSTPTTVESAKKAAAIKGGPPEVIRAEPGWWRPLFYVAAIPAVAQAAGALSGVAVESPVWLLGPEGCAMESRRSLAKLLGIRGRAAVRWQEAVAGSGVVIGMGKQGRVFKTVDEEEDEEGELDEDGNLCVKCSFDPDESEAAVNSWGALFTEQRNRYPMIIGAGVCLLAGLSGSNTVIYYASSVLKEAGVDDPGLLTLVVGLPNVLGGVIALLCTDKYGRRPLLLWSFGGMAVCLAAFSTAAFATPGNPVNNTFCALATPVTSGGLQEGGEFVGDAMAAICDDLAAYTTATVTQRSFEPLRTTTLVAIPLYTFFFSMGAGPVPWLLYSEVFPTRIRSRATAVVTAINYSCNTIVGASFLPLIGAFGLKGTYAMYAVLCAVGYVFVDNLVFETKGLALQDIEGVMLTKEAQWSGRELASSEEGGDAYGQTGAGEDAKEESGMGSDALGSGFWWTEVGEKMEKVMGDVRRSMDELGTAEVEEETAASVEDDDETIDVK